MTREQYINAVVVVKHYYWLLLKFGVTFKHVNGRLFYSWDGTDEWMSVKNDRFGVIAHKYTI